MQKSETAWKTAARMAALAEDTDDDYEREHFIRLRDAWITLANRCEPFDLPGRDGEVALPITHANVAP
jgi:hypothetical protein